MIIKSLSLHAITLGFFASMCVSQAALNFEITNAQLELGGATKTVLGSGSSANFTTGVVAGTSFAIFDISSNDGGTLADYADLKVTYLTDGAGVGSNVMIAQTVNSQGLVDVSTLSVLTNSSSGGTIGLKFEWYEAGSFTGGIYNGTGSLLSTQVNYTVLDIDFNQVVSVASDDIGSYALNGETLLTATEADGNWNFKDDGASSNFDDPLTAVSFTTTEIDTHTIEVGRQAGAGAALFIFEFRDPGTIAPFVDPEVTIVPEPSAYSLLAGCFAFAWIAVRRRK